jgi:HSP20 family protein
MKLPIQKAQSRQEPMSQESDMWPMALSLFERYIPEEWMKQLAGLDRGMYREMRTWMPKVDITESDKELSVMADVPGVKPEDIKVEISDDNMILSGQSEEEKDEHGQTWHRMERKSGRFYRQFLLPSSVDRDKIEATIDNGILTIKMPKKPESQSRTISVKKKESQPGASHGGNEQPWQKSDQQGGQEKQGGSEQGNHGG